MGETDLVASNLSLADKVFFLPEGNVTYELVSSVHLIAPFFTTSWILCSTRSFSSCNIYLFRVFGLISFSKNFSSSCLPHRERFCRLLIFPNWLNNALSGPEDFKTMFVWVTAQKMKFSIKDSFSKCDQIRRKLQIWSNLWKKSLMERFIFCAVSGWTSTKFSIHKLSYFPCCVNFWIVKSGFLHYTLSNSYLVLTPVRADCCENFWMMHWNTPLVRQLN